MSRLGGFARLIGALLEGFSEGLSDLDGSNAKRTLCCDVKMHDVWMHKPSCPKAAALSEKFVAWKKENPNADLVDMPHFDLRPRGDKDGNCPECDYPTDHFGIYTVGEACPYCGYVEKRRPKS